MLQLFHAAVYYSVDFGYFNCIIPSERSFNLLYNLYYQAVCRSLADGDFLCLKAEKERILKLDKPFLGLREFFFKYSERFFGFADRFFMLRERIINFGHRFYYKAYLFFIAETFVLIAQAVRFN